MSPLYAVAILHRYGDTVVGAFPDAPSALAFLDKRRAEWPEHVHIVYDADAPEVGDCEARLRAEVAS